MRRDSKTHPPTDVFEVAIADRRYQIVERHRLSRSQSERFIGQRERSLWLS
jgi:hypothetical protein